MNRVSTSLAGKGDAAEAPVMISDPIFVFGSHDSNHLRCYMICFWVGRLPASPMIAYLLALSGSFIAGVQTLINCVCLCGYKMVTLMSFVRREAEADGAVSRNLKSSKVLLLGLIGSLAGVNLIVLAIWMSDNPAAVRAICTRQNLAVLGIVMASSAVTAVVGAGAADAVLCFGLLLLLLVGLVLVMRGVAGAYAVDSWWLGALT